MMETSSGTILPKVAKNDLGVVFFPAFDWAISPTHPEREERLLYTQDQLAEEGLFDLAGIVEYRPDVATHALVEQTHFCLPSAEAVCSPSHLVAAGGALRAARLVMEGEAKRAFALVRPPGHHAMRITHGNRGFCNVNMEAVMVDYIRRTYPLPNGEPMRIAIVDTDCHHGDGTQDIYWNDPYTLCISLHQDGRTLYPGSGFVHEAGGPGALGRTINIPLPPHTGDAGYLYALDAAVLPMLEHFQPHIIINAAGQDNHFTDPLAHMRLTAQGYAMLTQRLQPHIAVLEGGYSIRGALPYVNLAICLALAERPFDAIYEPQWTKKMTAQDAKNAAYIAEVCAEAVDAYFAPAKTPAQGEARNGWWVRHKDIYYDTDMICDTQEERIRLCEHCPGITCTDSQSARVRKSLCVLLPPTACEACRAEARNSIEQAKAQKKYAYVRSIGVE